MKPDFQLKNSPPSKKKTKKPESKHCQCTLMPLVSSSSNEPMSKASAALTSPRGGIKGGGYWKSQRRKVQLLGDSGPGPNLLFYKEISVQHIKVSQSVQGSFKLTQITVHSSQCPQRRCSPTTQFARSLTPAMGQGGAPHTHKRPEANAG